MTLPAAIATLGVAAVSALAPTTQNDARLRILVGGYTGTGPGEGRGIHRVDYDPTTRRFGRATLVAETQNPSFLAAHPTLPLVIVAGEFGRAPGQQGEVRTFATVGDGLEAISTRRSGGRGPCFVGFDPSGRVALVANYGDGTVASYRVDDRGALGEPASAITHTGRGARDDRQSGPHAHSIRPSPDGRFAVAADLGIDKLMVYRLDADAGTITPHEPPSVATAPGAGPRHMAWTDDGSTLLVANELDLTLTAYDFDARLGTLTPGQTLSTLPAETTPERRATASNAEVAVHPSGRFVYVSVRGVNMIATYRLEAGRLTAVGHTPLPGRTPRHFAIDASGTSMVVALQDSGLLVALSIDLATGALSDTGARLETPKPSCVLLLR